MITPDQLLAAVVADSTTPGTPDYTPLSGLDILLIENLVKSYKAYGQNVGLWPDLHGKLLTEQGTPTDKTYVLRAVLAALNELPEISAESEGTDKSPGYFSVLKNWDLLAQDVLNTLFEVPTGYGPQTWGLVNRTIEDLTIKDENTGLI